ncbi:hypothetical protein LTR86_004846 [Recurvomyces mirabilis]|nr:hypothetical protein LTR86_004846 [Recurvomyces mirabilis]
MPPKGSKRKAAAQSGNANTKQPKQDGQKAVSKDIHIALDEGFHGGGKVHVADDGTIFDASLNQSQVAKNNNKVSMCR